MAQKLPNGYDGCLAAPLTLGETVRPVMIRIAHGTASNQFDILCLYAQLQETLPHYAAQIQHIFVAAGIIVCLRCLPQQLIHCLYHLDSHLKMAPIDGRSDGNADL